MEERINTKGNGSVVCDNPKCDYKESGFDMSDYKKFLNKPCPKCGDNLLTDEDFKRAEQLLASINFLNSLSEEQIEMQLKAQGLDPKTMPDDKVKMTVGTHKKFSFKFEN